MKSKSLSALVLTCLIAVNCFAGEPGMPPLDEPTPEPQPASSQPAPTPTPTELEPATSSVTVDLLELINTVLWAL